MGYGKAMTRRMRSARAKRTSASPAKQFMDSLYDLASDVESDFYLKEEFENMGTSLTDAAQYDLETSDDKRTIIDMLTDALDSAQSLEYEAESYERRIKKYIARARKVKVIPSEKKIVHLTKAEVEVMKRRVARGKKTNVAMRRR